MDYESALAEEKMNNIPQRTGSMLARALWDQVGWKLIRIPACFEDERKESKIKASGCRSERDKCRE